jgi:hypothetical protein
MTFTSAHPFTLQTEHTSARCIASSSTRTAGAIIYLAVGRTPAPAPDDAVRPPAERARPDEVMDSLYGPSAHADRR